MDIYLSASLWHFRNYLQIYNSLGEIVTEENTVEEVYKITVWSRRAATRYGYPSVRYGSKFRANCIVKANKNVQVKVEKLTGTLEDVTNEFS